MIQLAWLWLRHQPRSALTLWFKDRMERNGSRRRKTTIVALARKLLVALWKYVSAGVSRRARELVFRLGVRPSGAAMTALLGYLSVNIGVFLFAFLDHTVRKGRGDHPTEERNLGPEAVNPTPGAAISHLRAPGHPSLLALELPARLDDRSPTGRRYPRRNVLHMYNPSTAVEFHPGSLLLRADVHKPRTSYR
jgi:hypothetical protein